MRGIKGMLVGAAAAAVLLTGCREDPNRGEAWDNAGTPRNSGPGAYDSNTSVAPMGNDSAIGEERPETAPAEGQAQTGQQDKVGPASAGTESGPSGTSGEGRGWGGSGLGSNVRGRIQETERGMDGGTSVHAPEPQ